MSHTLEEHIKIPSFPLCRSTETINYFRHICISQGHFILSIYYTVAINVLIFNVTYTIFSKCLPRAGINLFLAFKQSQSLKTERLQ